MSDDIVRKYIGQQLHFLVHRRSEKEYIRLASFYDSIVVVRIVIIIVIVVFLNSEKEYKKLFFGILFVAITTLTTNIWAQYVYNNIVTNYGKGTHYDSDSLINMFVFTLIAVGVIILYVIYIRKMCLKFTEKRIYIVLTVETN